MLIWRKWKSGEDGDCWCFGKKKTMLKERIKMIKKEWVLKCDSKLMN